MFKILLAVQIFIGCNQSNDNKKEVKEVSVNKCDINYTINSSEVILKSNNNTLNINYQDLDFITYSIDEVKIECNKNKLYINYLERIGTRYIETEHYIEEKNGEFILKGVYTMYSDRHRFSLEGKDITDAKIKYDGSEPENIENIIDFSFSEDEDTGSSLVDMYLNKIKIAINKKDGNKISFLGNKFFLEKMLDETSIYGNISKYNDIAYYLEEYGNYKESIFLLEKIINTFPDRVVAYLNLGDAYWGLKNEEKAKEAYSKYVGLMKSQVKDLSKIPQRVYDRINRRRKNIIELENISDKNYRYSIMSVDNNLCKYKDTILKIPLDEVRFHSLDLIEENGVNSLFYEYTSVRPVYFKTIYFDENNTKVDSLENGQFDFSESNYNIESIKIDESICDGIIQKELKKVY